MQAEICYPLLLGEPAIRMHKNTLSIQTLQVASYYTLHERKNQGVSIIRLVKPHTSSGRADNAILAVVQFIHNYTATHIMYLLH